MKFSSIAFAVGSIAFTTAAAFQNLQSSDAQLNISSPLQNGIYVANETLPLTYIPAASANLRLDIYLRDTVAPFIETVLASNADISNNPANAISDTVGNTVYYQHSINYGIPCATPAGEYEVIYHNANTNVNTTIPISIRTCPVSSSTVLPLSPAPTDIPSVANSTEESQPSVNGTVPETSEPSTLSSSNGI